MTQRVLHALAGLIQQVYRRLPFGWDFRLRMKARIFRWLSPLLHDTQAYRRWQAAAVGAGERVATRRSRDREGLLLEKYVFSLLRRSQSHSGGRHVPLAPGLSKPDGLKAKAIAFYLPQFHPIEQNDRWWGRGFTEWTNVSKAMPQFVGHEQPRLPGELGYYDLRLVDVMKRQVELATLHGIHAFCFHYYWFSGQRLLERPLDQFVASPDIDFPFCLCWANENWTRRWDGKDEDVLMSQNYGDDNDDAFIHDLMPYLRDRRYLRISGRPLVVVYRPSLLPDCSRTLAHWRKACREAGLGEIFIAMVQFDLTDPSVHGFDAALEFPPHKVAEGLPSINHTLDIINPDYAGYVVDYAAVVENAINWPKPDYPLFRGVFPGWDNEARKPGKGYTFAHATPAAYGKWLASAADFAAANPIGGESLVFINAWNEWAEGAYLEPDREHGYAYLQATREALLGRERAGKILLVVHDAHPHGAQYLALSLLREMRVELRLDVEVLLLGPGILQAEFAKLAVVHELFGEQPVQLDDLVKVLRQAGCDLVLLNTAVSGRIIRPLSAAGFPIVSLVHELPGVIMQFGLQAVIADIAELSDHVVVASAAVAESLERFAGPDSLHDKVSILPQGLFTRSRYRGLLDKSAVRRRLRAKLGLAEDARVVLSVGYGDHRKGLDLLAAALCIAARSDDRLHAVWVGHHDVAQFDEAQATLGRAGLQGRLHFVGLDFDTDDYYAGADVYALASREDPFPSVVLESLSVGTPVVAFAGTGGGADLLANGGGVTVPAFDTGRFAGAILELLDDEPYRVALGESGVALVDSDFSFRSYVMDVLALTRKQIPRVSVIVPNFNYARYLKARLASIAGQSLPPYEIIVVDDASTDASLATLQELRGAMAPEPRVVANEVNSGSVFRQWLRGVELARGEFVWIAEADDLSTPDFLETIVDHMQRDQDVVMGFTQSQQIDLDGNCLADDYLEWTHDVAQLRWRAPYVCPGADEVEASLFLKNTIPNVSAVVFRRTALLDVLRENIEEIAGYRVAGDWVVYVRLLRRGRIAYDPTACNLHRRHAAGVVSNLPLEQHWREVVAVQQLAARLFALGPGHVERAAAYSDHLSEYFQLKSNVAAVPADDTKEKAS